MLWRQKMNYYQITCNTNEHLDKLGNVINMKGINQPTCGKQNKIK